jgi:mannan polymerase II complex ANP1 subunit
MAKRMQYSVVGLPHYTIWHLYEPSVDDIRHMEEMEQERKQREREDEARRSRREKISDQFDVPAGKSQWEKDKEALRQEALAKEKEGAKTATVAAAEQTPPLQQAQQQAAQPAQPQQPQAAPPTVEKVAGQQAAGGNKVS